MARKAKPKKRPRPRRSRTAAPAVVAPVASGWQTMAAGWPLDPAQLRAGDDGRPRLVEPPSRCYTLDRDAAALAQPLPRTDPSGGPSDG